MGTANFLRQNYGFAGREFIRLMSSELFMQTAEHTYRDYFRQLTETDTTEKQSMAAAMILTADRLITSDIFKDGDPLTVGEMAKFLQSKASVSVGERGYKYMCDWVIMNFNHFRADNEHGEVYGVIQDDWAFIIRAVFEREAENKGFSCRALLSWLKARGLIQTRGKHMTRPKRIGGKPPAECVVLKLPDDNYTSDELREIPEDGVPF